MGQSTSNNNPKSTNKVVQLATCEITPSVMKTEISTHTFGSNRAGHRKAQRRRPRWRKNYQMSASTPCWTDGRNRETLTGMTVQSLHMQEHLSNAKLRHKRILKLLKKCTQTYEGIISQSYVESMRSFDTSCERLSGFISAEDNLIILEDRQFDTNLVRPYEYDTHVPDTYKHSIPHTHVAHFNKNYSEIIFKSDNETNIGGMRMDPPPYGENVMSCSDSYDHKNMFKPSKLRLNEAFSSDYVDSPTTPLMDGHRTPFLNEEDDSNHMSFYYDNEFADNHNSRNSDLEAAICNEYASLLDKAGNRLQGLQLDEAQSDVSSDFDSIFPTSFSTHLSDGSAGLPSLHEENSLELSVPNYTDMTANPKHDYQLAFPATVSLCSEGRSICAGNPDTVYQNRSSRTANQIPKPPRCKTSLKHVSFSDDALQDSGSGADSESSSAYFDNSTTWLEMKQKYTTWGQVKSKLQTDSPKKSKSVDELPMRDRERVCSELNTPDINTKRYSLTLWEMYKRAHSMSLVSEGELTTPQAYLDPKQSDLKNSIDELLNDVLEPHTKPKTSAPKLKPLPDVSFLLKTKHQLHTFAWWSEIFEQPSFCDRRSAVSECCGKCERKSSDHTVIVFQGAGVEQQKCDMSFIKDILNPTSCSCREKLSDISSGIATGSSGVTPREPNSWQHIADFLKKRQRHSREVNSCGSLNSTLSDQQLLDVVGCIEAADSLIKCQQSSDNKHSEIIMRLWKLVSAVECILSIGLKSHKLVTVPMGRIRTRVSIWDVVEDSCKSAGEVTDSFQKILSQLAAHKVEDVTVKFCLFVAGLMNSQTLDFWLQLLQYNSSLMDRYYEHDSLLRSKNVGDKKLQCEVVQALRQLSFHTWDLDFYQIKEAYIPLNDAGAEAPTLPSKKFIKRSATTPYLPH